MAGRAQLERLLGESVRRVTPLRGGDICETVGVELARGGRYVVKHLHDAPPGFFEAEASGLRWLGAGGLPVPAVRSVSRAALVLTWIETAPETPSFAENLGRTLAEFHRGCAETSGARDDNFLAGLPQPNPDVRPWARWFMTARVDHALELARARGGLSTATVQLVRDARGRLEDVLVEDEPLVRLHGDLWRGNVLCTPAQEPVFIDPAAYVGAREVDLAMLALFGGWGGGCQRAYEEVYPLRVGWRQRFQAYQLYPLLVHVALFGRSYEAQVAQTARAVSEGGLR